LTSVAARTFAFTVLPILLALLHIRFSKVEGDRLWKLELCLIYLFVLGVGGGGLSGFFGHIFASDAVAESIGWAKGSPFQQEMGFSNLAFGILGFVAATKRDGFREATVVGIVVLAVGASAVHIADIIESGNLAPGNSLQILPNLLKPAVLIPLLIMSRRAELAEPVDSSFDRSRSPAIQNAAVVTGVVGTGFGIGFMIEEVVPATALAVVVAMTITIRSAASRPEAARPL
jgi:hypothetical protein